MTSDIMKTAGISVLAAGLTVALIILAGVVPFASIIFFICVGVPLAVLASKYDFKAVIPAVLLAGVGYWAYSGSWIDVTTVATVTILPGVIAGYMLGRQKPFFSVLLATCVIVCVGWLVDFIIIERFYGIGVDDIMNGIVVNFQNGLNAAALEYENMGVQFGGISSVDLVKEISGTIGVIVQLYLPSFIVLLSMIMGYILLRISGFAIRKTKAAQINVVPFSMMRAPRSMCWVAVLAYFVYMFLTPFGKLWSVLANVVLILQVILAVCGFSFVEHWLKGKIKFGLLRGLIYIGVLFVAGLLMSFMVDLLVIIAILDSGRDFRKIGQSHEQ